MINILKNRQDPTMIGNYELEVTLGEQHEYKNDVTAYPIEEGFDITDHIHRNNEKLTINGLISDTPFPLRSMAMDDFVIGSGENRSVKAVEILLKIAGYSLPKQEKSLGLAGRDIYNSENLLHPENSNNPEIIDIISGLRIYTNMVCTGLSFPRDSKTGQALYFTMSFVKIFTVKSNITTINKVSDLNGKAPNIKNQAPSTKNVGTQTGSKPDSILLNIAKKLRIVK